MASPNEISSRIRQIASVLRNSDNPSVSSLLDDLKRVFISVELGVEPVDSDEFKNIVAALDLDMDQKDKKELEKKTQDALKKTHKDLEKKMDDLVKKGVPGQDMGSVMEGVEESLDDLERESKRKPA